MLFNHPIILYRNIILRFMLSAVTMEQNDKLSYSKKRFMMCKKKNLSSIKFDDKKSFPCNPFLQGENFFSVFPIFSFSSTFIFFFYLTPNLDFSYEWLITWNLNLSCKSPSEKWKPIYQVVVERNVLHFQKYWFLPMSCSQ